MLARLAIILCLILPIHAVAPSAQQPNTPPAYRLLNAKNIEKFQQELNRATADGYEVMLAWPGYNLALLRYRAGGEPEPTYLVLNGEKKIQESLAQDYRAVSDTLTVYGGAPLVVARKASDPKGCESLLLRANRTSTLDKEIQDARARGFRVVGMDSDDGGHAALLERVPGAPRQSGPADDVALIAASSQDALQKELAGRAAAGYRIAQASSWKETLLSLERREEEKPAEYRVISTTKSGTLEREINAAAAEGFHYTPGTLHAQQKGSVPIFGFGQQGAATEYVAIMEKHPGEGSREYVVIGARRASTVVKEFDDAVAKGLVPAALALGFADQETLVLFERVLR